MIVARYPGRTVHFQEPVGIAGGLVIFSIVVYDFWSLLTSQGRRMSKNV